jgi:hypothetical protein
MSQKSSAFFSESKDSISNRNFIIPGEKDSNYKSVMKQNYIEQLVQNGNIFDSELNIEKSFKPKTEEKLKLFKNNEFIRFSEIKMPPMTEKILDSNDLKLFSSISLFEIPKIENLIELLKKENSNEQKKNLFSFLCFILFKNYEKINEKNLFEIINNFQLNEKMFNNKNQIEIDILILNCFIALIKNEKNCEIFIKKNGFKNFLFNLFFVFKNFDSFRIKRKISGFFALICFYNNNNSIILKYFKKFNLILENIQFDSDVIRKFYQLMKEKQNFIIDKIIDFYNKNSQEKNNLIITYFQVLIIFLEIQNGQLIFDQNKFIQLFKCLKNKDDFIEIEIKKYILKIKKLIREFYY